MEMDFSEQTENAGQDGILLFVPDFDAYEIKVILRYNFDASSRSEFSGNQYETAIPILENVDKRKYYGRSGSVISDLVVPSDENTYPLCALYYGKDHIGVVPVEEIVNGMSPEADYTYLFTVQFHK